MGKVFIKTDVLVGLTPHWGIEGGLSSFRLAPALVFCPVPFCLPHAAAQDKKAGTAHASPLRCFTKGLYLNAPQILSSIDVLYPPD